MSDSSMMAEPEPSYSLFVEMALAVGTTVLALYLCRGNKKGEMLTSEDSGSDKINAVKDRMAKEMKGNRLRNLGKNAAEQAYEGLGQHFSGGEVEATHLNSVASVSRNASLEQFSKDVDVKATQTLNGDLINGNESPDLKILWKAVIVNAQGDMLPRYKTELRVDIDGTMTYCESFQKEGIAGMGMHQILVKVQ